MGGRWTSELDLTRHSNLGATGNLPPAGHYRNYFDRLETTVELFCLRAFARAGGGRAPSHAPQEEPTDLVESGDGSQLGRAPRVTAILSLIVVEGMGSGPATVRCHGSGE